MRPDRTKDTISYGRYIDEQVDKTGRQLRLTEIFGGVFLLVVGLLSFFLAAAVIDHWIAPLQAGGRWGLLILLVAGVSLFVLFRIVPLLFRKVNPVYSAHTIERQSPAIKNSLVNTLLLRQEGQGVSKGVRRAVEEQAAQRLSQSPAESAVDRSKIIRLGYLLVALMAVVALYKLISPKDPLTTWGRIAAPWSNVAAPTRVVIDQVRHSANEGTTQADGTTVDWVFAEQKPVEVDAFVRGLKAADEVKLFWSTTDGRVENQAIPMKRFGNDPRQFRCLLPDDTVGLRQDVRYYVAAGDARSATFHIEVRTPPVLTMKRVEYRFPAYTRKRPETRSGGDITALAGTLVTLHAEANQDIQRATLDVGCDGTIDHTFQVSGRNATGTFQLALTPTEKSATGSPPLAPHVAGKSVEYLLRMTSADGHQNPQPIRYRLDVLPDQSPRVKIVQPEAKDAAIELPLNGLLPITVKADDPDFALSSVRLSATPADAPNGKLLFDLPLSEDPASFENNAKSFDNSAAPFQFRPDDGAINPPLKVGDVIHLKATARDNRHNLLGDLEPNVTSDPQPGAPRLAIKIVAPDNQGNNKQAGNDMQPKKQDEKKQDNKQDEKKQDDTKPKEKQGDSKQDDSKQGDQKKQDGKKQDEKQKDDTKKDGKQDGSKQAGNKQGDQGDRKEPSKSDQAKPDNKSGDLKDLFNQLKREAEKEQGKQKSPQEKQSPAGNQKKQNGGGSSDSPDAKEMPPEGSPQNGGAGAKKTQSDGKSPAGGSNTKERADPRTDNGDGTTSPAKSNDGTGAKKTGDKLTGQGSEKTNKLPDEMNPPSNPASEKSKDAKSSEGSPAKTSGAQPDKDPMANPKAKGDAGQVKNANPADAKKDDAKRADSDTKQGGGNNQDTQGAGNHAEASKNKTGAPPSLDEKSKASAKSGGPKKQPKSDDDRPDNNNSTPAVDQKSNKNMSESGTSDGDHKGGSKGNGGQAGKQSGAGAAGKGSSADQGMGAAPQSGEGETGSGPGTKAKSPTPTGKQGNEDGNGSTTRPGGAKAGQAKSADQKQASGDDSEAGSAVGTGKRDASGDKRVEGDPQSAGEPGARKIEHAPPSDPDLEAAKKAADLVLKYIENHPDDERFKDPRVIEWVKQTRANRDAADKNGAAGDIARQQLRDLSRTFSSRGIKQDDGAGYGQLRGATDLKAYPLSEYNDRSEGRPKRKP